MTKLRKLLSPAALLTACTVLIVTGTSCRKRTETATSPSGQEAKPISQGLMTNELSSLPGSVYQNQQSSLIQWQPWTAETLALAKKTNRLIFAVIVMPQQPAYQKVLGDLASDGETVKRINSRYVPVVIDGDASREMGLLAVDLSSQIKKPIQFPFYCWMSPEGNPVSWMPVSDGGREANLTFFAEVEKLVFGMWAEDPAYMIKNSGFDQEKRRERLAQGAVSAPYMGTAGDGALHGLRQLLSLYDPDIHSLDESGSIFPASAIEMLASAALLPGMPRELRQRSSETTRGLMQDLLTSPMFDPLDGGVFASRYRTFTSLPLPDRNAVSQARVSQALFRGYLVTGDPLALERALGCLAYAETNYATTDGLFSSGATSPTDLEKWLWKMEDIKQTLGAEDAAWWAGISGVTEAGNVPREADVKLRYYQMNTFSLRKTIAALAAEKGMEESEFRKRFESIRHRLLVARNERLGQKPKDDHAQAAATFRMVSAYAAAYTATGDTKFREKAVLVLTRAQSTYGSGNRLVSYTGDSAPSIAEGRAFTYALAAQAALDVADITGDSKWNEWAANLATTAVELFAGNGFVVECSKEANLIDLPVTDQTMLFDDSTAGIFLSVQGRLAYRMPDSAAVFGRLATPLLEAASSQPMVHTDMIQATLASEFSASMVVGYKLPAELDEALARLPLGLVRRKSSMEGAIVPTGTVSLTFPGKTTEQISSPAALKDAFLPSR